MDRKRDFPNFDAIVKMGGQALRDEKGKIFGTLDSTRKRLIAGSPGKDKYGNLKGFKNAPQQKKNIKKQRTNTFSSLTLICEFVSGSTYGFSGDPKNYGMSGFRENYFPNEIIIDKSKFKKSFFTGKIQYVENDNRKRNLNGSLIPTRKYILNGNNLSVKFDESTKTHWDGFKPSSIGFQNYLCNKKYDKIEKVKNDNQNEFIKDNKFAKNISSTNQKNSFNSKQQLIKTIPKENLQKKPT